VTCEHGGVTVRGWARRGSAARRRALLGYAVAVAGPLSLAAALRPVAGGDQATNMAFAFLLVVLAAAALDGLGPGLVASVTAFAAFDLGFVRPHGTLAVAARRDAGVLVGFLVSAVVMSALVALAEQRRAHAEREADDARLLYLLGAADPASDDAAADVAALAEVVRRETGATAVVVGTGHPIQVLYDGGTGADRAAALLRAPAATASLADGDTVTIAVGGGGGEHRALLDAFATRVAATVDRGRLRAERRARDLLAQTERQRASLVSAVSHDLRTPLAAIKASASALGEPGLSDAERTELRGSIGIEVDRLDRMVRNLLSLGRIEGGRLVAHPEPVPVDELVGSVLSRLRPQLRERRLELDVPADLPPVNVDPVQGEQAFGNLVENVIAHTPLNAGLIVRAAARGGWVTVRVADEGPGIPQQDRERVFQRFARGTHHGPGAGLGLAIARAYAEANGGGLDVAPSDCGAAFDLWLPAVLA
jgi:two-component system sensor histidine kinase KdpD